MALLPHVGQQSRSNMSRCQQHLIILVTLLAAAVSRSPSSATPSDSSRSSSITMHIIRPTTAASTSPDRQHIANTRCTRLPPPSMCWAASSSWAAVSRGAPNHGTRRSRQQGRIGQGWGTRSRRVNRSSPVVSMRVMGAARKKRRSSATGSAAVKAKKKAQYIQVEDLESDAWR